MLQLSLKTKLFLQKSEQRILNARFAKFTAMYSACLKQLYPVGEADLGK
jgi:hypothetical protein